MLSSTKAEFNFRIMLYVYTNIFGFGLGRNMPTIQCR